MHTLRSRLAILLLLCFTRVLLPDAWVLALHAHQHTTEEAAQKPDASPQKAKALLSAKHQHCAVDHFYDVPFQAALPLEFALFTSYGASATEQSASVWLAASPYTADLRGPPSQG